MISNNLFYPKYHHYCSKQEKKLTTRSEIPVWTSTHSIHVIGIQKRKKKWDRVMLSIQITMKRPSEKRRITSTIAKMYKMCLCNELTCAAHPPRVTVKHSDIKPILDALRIITNNSVPSAMYRPAYYIKRCIIGKYYKCMNICKVCYSSAFDYPKHCHIMHLFWFNMEVISSIHDQAECLTKGRDWSAPIESKINHDF